MGQHPERLSATELDSIYLRRIRPDLLPDTGASPSPTALLIGGQPGAGKALASLRARNELAAQIGSPILVSGDELREYHPYWRANARTDPLAAERTQHDTGLWYARLTNDAIAQKANLAFETSMRRPEPVMVLTDQLRASGYAIVAIIVAADRDQSRLAAMTRYDVARTAGGVPRFVPASSHDDAFLRVRDTLAQLEGRHAVDALRVVTRAGVVVYRNEFRHGTWDRPAHAVETLDATRDRPFTARELADNALRWQTIVQRLGSDRVIANEVVAQAVAWCNEATERAERDPDARQYLIWGREAEAFRTMNHQQFLREFPHHEQTVRRFSLALDHFEAEFGNPVDRNRATSETRVRFAERIAEGRFAHKQRAKTRVDERTR